MARLASGICLLVLVLALAGCGGGTKTVTETRTQPSTGGETTNQGSTTAPETTAGGGGATTIAVPKGQGNYGPHYFETPSHNIGCYIDSHSARCDIRSRTWSPPPEPASCKKIGLDFGQGVVVGPHRSEFVCAGDTSLGGRAVLGYGSSARRETIACVSQPAGVTCTNSANGHGFFLSRQRYRLF
jgi:hypothetical protein